MQRLLLFLGAMGLILLLSYNGANAQDLVYNPINPSFAGGNYFNGQWLLAYAQAQNKISEDRVDLTRLTTDPLEDFQNSLNRQILSQLSRNLISSVFGEDAFSQEGQYEIGNFLINISPGDGGISIIINDLSNGNETTIVVPYY